ncbi:MAG: glutamate mutase L, partial [Anaerolineae bacterium]
MARDYLSIESILALECGSTTTQALLIDRVDGSYRIIARTEAPSSVEPPWSDVTAAVRTALRELSDVVGWRLLDEREQIIQPEHQEGGVDAVVAVASAGQPLRLVLSGLMSDVSLSSARHALSTSYTVVEGLI